MPGLDKHNWLVFKTEDIIRGKDSNGVLFLQSFLIDYKNLTGEKVINAGCSKCIYDYHNKYKLKLNEMNTNNETPKFRLKKKYIGLPLGFGTGNYAQTLNTSDENAAILLQFYQDPGKIFDIYPADMKDEVLTDFIAGNLPKKKATPKKKAASKKKATKKK